VRWLSRQHTRVITPLWLNVADQLVLMSRVAAVSADAGLRTRVLESVEVLEREDPPTPVFAAIARHARGVLERDPDALADAAEALRSRRPLYAAAAAEDAGGELARIGCNTAAIEQLNAAFDILSAGEAVADARRVGRALRELGVDRRTLARPRGKTGWGALTPAELKIVDLIANGATNREVAEQLNLSTNTVKTHVRKAFAKLAINSRSQLRGYPTSDAGVQRPE
jgi:DNA-binding CsgD family transcriptional regulator